MPESYSIKGALFYLWRYKRSVRKLNDLTITCLDISIAISVVSQVLNTLCQKHMDISIRIKRYIKCALRKSLSYEYIGHT